MKRRDFLKVGPLSASLTLGSMKLSASDLFSDLQISNQITVVVQLFGGNDGLNTLIPADNDPYYSKYRIKTHVKKEGLKRIGSSTMFFNPNLAQGHKSGLVGLFEEGKLAIVQGVGYPNNSLSHFRSTDIWLSGKVPTSDSELLDTGWLGKYYAKSPSIEDTYPSCINIGNETSLLFQTGIENVSLAINDPNQFYESGKGLGLNNDTINQNSRYAREYNYLFDLGKKANIYSTVIKRVYDSGKNTLEYPKSKLADELKLVARLISGGNKSKVYLVGLSGFDTHGSQGSTDGTHAGLLKQVSEAISFFMADLKAQKLSSNVVGFTMSEFGRRPYENESQGTDHGNAGHMFVFGDNVKGNLYGRPLDFTNLDKNGDFKFQYDFRSIYAEVMDKWISGTDSSKNIFGKQYDYVDGGLLRKAGELAVLSNPVEKKSLIYPNPSPDGSFTLLLDLKAPDIISVDQVSISSEASSLLKEIPMGVGSHELKLKLQGGPGTYIIHVRANLRNESHRLIRL
jgi:uncharacterized protein (DUF1501 family)